MSYFQDLSDECDRLTEKANAYLEALPFIGNEEVAERLCKAAWKLFKDSGEDWDGVPWWVANIVDGHMPFYGVPRNGSLRFSLGFSVSAQEANLRNLMEIAEGRETKELDLPTVAGS